MSHIQKSANKKEASRIIEKLENIDTESLMGKIWAYRVAFSSSTHDLSIIYAKLKLKNLYGESPEVAIFSESYNIYCGIVMETNAMCREFLDRHNPEEDFVKYLEEVRDKLVNILKLIP